MKGSDDDRPELQIWRRDSGGGNNYTKTSFSLINATSDTNVYEYYPDTPLEFQEGDILGVYTPKNSNTQLEVYYQDNTGPENFGENDIVPPAPSTFTLGSPINQNDYPLVSVEISTGNQSSV